MVLLLLNTWLSIRLFISRFSVRMLLLKYLSFRDLRRSSIFGTWAFSRSSSVDMASPFLNSRWFNVLIVLLLFWEKLSIPYSRLFDWFLIDDLCRSLRVFHFWILVKVYLPECLLCLCQNVDTFFFGFIFPQSVYSLPK